jgi:hypothetical protein
MRVDDWKKLKEGELFEVKDPTPEWKNFFGQMRVGQLMNRYVGSLDGGYRQPLPVAANLGLFYIPWNNDRMDFLKRRAFEQQVTIYDKADEVPAQWRLDKCSARINGTTGSDPEIFVVRGASESLLPAFKFLPDKATVKKGVDHDTRAYSYWDGFAAEFGVRVGSCHGYLIDYLREGLLGIRNKATRFDRTAKLTLQNTMTIPEITMKDAKDEEVALGCLPSLHAYGDGPEIIPGSARDTLLRFAGGHIHFGIEGPIVKKDGVNMVKGCDLLAGVPAVALFASFDTPARRFYYGRAGEYRTPPHGLEYRTLSNAWLASPVIAHLVLNLARCGLKVGKEGLHDKLGLSESEVQGIINNCDVPKAKEWTLNNLPMFAKLLQFDGTIAGPNFKRVIEGGMQAIIKDPTDLVANWRLDGEWQVHSNDSRATWAQTCNAAGHVLVQG